MGPTTSTPQRDPTGSARAALDDMLTALAAAPSVHNTQPWLVHVGPDHIEIRPDRSRRLRVLDPTGRELTMSLGAAVFNLRAAMLNYGRTPILSIQPSTDRWGVIARVTPGRPCTPTFTARLFTWAIPRRHSNRQPFGPKPVSIEVLDELRAAAAAEGTRLVVATRARRELILDVTRAAERQLRRNTGYRQELWQWTSGRTGSFDGVPAAAIGPRSRHDAVPVRDFTPTHRGRTPLAVTFEAEPTIAVLYTDGDTRTDWLRAGQALQRVLLTATLRHVTASLMSQPLEVPESRAEIRVGAWTPQMVLRLGYAAPGPASPRRPPELFLTEPPLPGAPWLGVTSGADPSATGAVAAGRASPTPRPDHAGTSGPGCRRPAGVP
jgi:hypothetical protein